MKSVAFDRDLFYTGSVINGTPQRIAKARKLRRDMSLPEVLLWRELRGRPSGLKFRRQHPTDLCTMDFYCHRALLCIEVDGIAHDMGDNAEWDERRDAFLSGQGIATLRLPAVEVLKDLAGAVDAVVAACEARIAALEHPLQGEGDRP